MALAQEFHSCVRSWRQASESWGRKEKEHWYLEGQVGDSWAIEGRAVASRSGSLEELESLSGPEQRMPQVSLGFAA